MRKPDNLSICKERMEQMEQKKRFPSLRGRITADAAVIGGGLSGITISLWLAKAGLKVAVAEAFRVGSGALIAPCAYAVILFSVINVCASLAIVPSVSIIN